MQRLNGHSLVAHKKMLLMLDIDLTLLPGMRRDTTAEQRLLIQSLYNRTEGGVGFVTGRGMENVDECFPGSTAVSVEHHAAYRLPDPSNLSKFILTENVGKLDANKLTDVVSRTLATQFRLVNPGETTLRSGEVSGTDPRVVVEPKDYALAIIHGNTVGEGGPEFIAETLRNVMNSNNLCDTHTVKVGFDTIEITPKGFDKRNAVRDFMAHPLYQGRRPVFVGDNMADAVAMDEIFNKYDGQGIAVGTTIPTAPYVHYRTDGIADTWNYLAEVNDRLTPIMVGAGVKRAPSKPATPAAAMAGGPA